MLKKFENYGNSKIKNEEIFVVYRYPEIELPYNIYLSKTEAEKEAEQTNKDIEKMPMFTGWGKEGYNQINKYKAISLYDCVELIKDAVKEGKDMDDFYHEEY